MSALFFDTSAVVKRYALETGSRWVAALTDPAAGNSCFIASVTRVELASGLYLKVRTGHISALQAQQATSAFRSELRTHFASARIGNAILNRAMRLVALHPLRAYDAIQLATALHLQRGRAVIGLPHLTFLSADRVLNQSAAAEGLVVDDPNLHP